MPSGGSSTVIRGIAAGRGGDRRRRAVAGHGDRLGVGRDTNDTTRPPATTSTRWHREPPGSPPRYAGGDTIDRERGRSRVARPTPRDRTRSEPAPVPTARAGHGIIAAASRQHDGDGGASPRRPHRQRRDGLDPRPRRRGTTGATEVTAVAREGFRGDEEVVDRMLDARARPRPPPASTGGGRASSRPAPPPPVAAIAASEAQAHLPDDAARRHDKASAAPAPASAERVTLSCTNARASSARRASRRAGASIIRPPLALQPAPRDPRQPARHGGASPSVGAPTADGEQPQPAPVPDGLVPGRRARGHAAGRAIEARPARHRLSRAVAATTTTVARPTRPAPPAAAVLASGASGRPRSRARRSLPAPCSGDIGRKARPRARRRQPRSPRRPAPARPATPRRRSSGVSADSEASIGAGRARPTRSRAPARCRTDAGRHPRRRRLPTSPRSARQSAGGRR